MQTSDILEMAPGDHETDGNPVETEHLRRDLPPSMTQLGKADRLHRHRDSERRRKYIVQIVLML